MYIPHPCAVVIMYGVWARFVMRRDITMGKILIMKQVIDSQFIKCLTNALSSVFRLG